MLCCIFSYLDLETTYVNTVFAWILAVVIWFTNAIALFDVSVDTESFNCIKCADLLRLSAKSSLPKYFLFSVVVRLWLKIINKMY